MNITNFTEYNLPQDAYTTFDATTLKTLIINRLNESSVFQDQNFEGSNLNAFIDVVAYMYHVLLFYLNTTSSEATFTTATLYENINKLVSNIGYKPLGRQTSLATISLSGLNTLTPNLYTIPRFSFITRNGATFTAIKDISFEKTNTNIEEVATDNSTLYQGGIVEYPLYSSTGEPFETVTIVNRKPDINNSSENENNIQFIADNSFTVFVKSIDTGLWREWTETSCLYLETSISTKYEKRLNEYGNYEFRFGNDLNGKKLKEGDMVQIYYILSDNQGGVVGANILRNSSFVIFTTSTFEEIVRDTYDIDTVFITPTTTSSVIINNVTDTTPVIAAESVQDIKSNAPKLFSLQNRLVTRGDYETFISKRFNNVVKSVSVLNNDQYTRDYLRYFYSIGLSRPNQNSRVLLNQVNYSNSTFFNNVYIFSVPTQGTILNEKVPNYLNSAQKQLIVNECNLIRDLTHNIVPSDPIYKAFSLGANIVGEVECVEIKDYSRLIIKKDRNVSINTTTLKHSVVNLFKQAFEKVTLGSIVNLTQLTNEILNLTGVESIATRRTDTNFEVPFISCVIWNPLYENDDVIVTSQNVKLADFQYGYYYEISNLFNNIIVETA
jgi:hypothetical protein